MAVVPQRAGLLGERKLRDAVGPGGIVPVAAEDIELRITFPRGIVAIETVSDARCVREQIGDGDRPLQRHEAECGVFVAAFDVDAHLRLRESRDVFRNGIVEAQLAILDQHHRGYRGDRLRHRIQPEDRIPRSSDGRCRDCRTYRNRQACRAVAPAPPRRESFAPRPCRESSDRAPAVFRQRIRAQWIAVFRPGPAAKAR